MIEASGRPRAISQATTERGKVSKVSKDKKNLISGQVLGLRPTPRGPTISPTEPPAAAGKADTSTEDDKARRARQDCLAATQNSGPTSRPGEIVPTDDEDREGLDLADLLFAWRRPVKLETKGRPFKILALTPGGKRLLVLIDSGSVITCMSLRELRELSADVFSIGVREKYSSASGTAVRVEHAGTLGLNIGGGTAHWYWRGSDAIPYGVRIIGTDFLGWHSAQLLMGAGLRLRVGPAQWVYEKLATTIDHSPPVAGLLPDDSELPQDLADSVAALKSAPALEDDVRTVASDSEVPPWSMTPTRARTAQQRRDIVGAVVRQSEAQWGTGPKADQRRAATEFLASEFCDILNHPDDGTAVPRIRGHLFQLQLKPGAKVPRKQRRRHVSKSEDDRAADREIAARMRENSMWRDSTTLYASNIFAVWKKGADGRLIKRPPPALCPDFREVIDYRQCPNAVTCDDPYGLPGLNDICEFAVQGQVHSTNDNFQFFHGVQADRATQDLMAARTASGFQRTPLTLRQGVKQGTSEGQRIMDATLGDEDSLASARAYVDDSVISSGGSLPRAPDARAAEKELLRRTRPSFYREVCSWDGEVQCGLHIQQHFWDLFGSLLRFRSKALTLGTKKARWFQHTLTEMFGWQLSFNSARLSEKRGQVFKEWPVPACTRDVRAFLGASSYCRRGISRFAQRTTALRDMVQNPPVGRRFALSPAAQREFQDIKAEIVRGGCGLCFARAGCPMLLDTDWSKGGKAADFYQLRAPDGHPDPDGLMAKVTTPDGFPRPRPLRWFRAKGVLVERVAVVSAACTKVEAARPPQLAEGAVVVWAVLKEKHLFAGRKTTIQCDHRTVSALMKEDPAANLLGRWALVLAQYSEAIKIVYRPAHKEGTPQASEESESVDALSRRGGWRNDGDDEAVREMNIAAVQSAWQDEPLCAIQDDPAIADVQQEFEDLLQESVFAPAAEQGGGIFIASLQSAPARRAPDDADTQEELRRRMGFRLEDDPHLDRLLAIQEAESETTGLGDLADDIAARGRAELRSDTDAGAGDAREPAASLAELANEIAARDRRLAPVRTAPSADSPQKAPTATALRATRVRKPIALTPPRVAAGHVKLGHPSEKVFLDFIQGTAFDCPETRKNIAQFHAEQRCNSCAAHARAPRPNQVAPISERQGEERMEFAKKVSMDCFEFKRFFPEKKTDCIMFYDLVGHYGVAKLPPKAGAKDVESSILQRGAYGVPEPAGSEGDRDTRFLEKAVQTLVGKEPFHTVNPEGHNALKVELAINHGKHTINRMCEDEKQAGRRLYRSTEHLLAAAMHALNFMAGAYKRVFALTQRAVVHEGDEDLHAQRVSVTQEERARALAAWWAALKERRIKRAFKSHAPKGTDPAQFPPRTPVFVHTADGRPNSRSWLNAEIVGPVYEQGDRPSGIQVKMLEGGPPKLRTMSPYQVRVKYSPAVAEREQEAGNR